MTKIIRSSFVPSAIALAFGAVACSQGTGDEASAASPEAITSDFTLACAGQVNETAPASGHVTYNVSAAQYGTSACHASSVDVTGSASVIAKASLPSSLLINSAQCSSVVADLALEEFGTDIVDCSELPPPCHPRVIRVQRTIAHTHVNASLVNTPTGLKCELPPTAVLSSPISTVLPDSNVHLLAKVTSPWAVESFVLDVTTK
jgi:hypothetical protein